MYARRQHPQGLRLVAVLAATVLAFGHDARGQVCDAHRRVGLVNVLAACTTRAVGVNAQVRRVDLDGLRFVGFGQHCHRAGTGMNTPLCFGGRHALHTVAARLKFEQAVHPIAGRTSVNAYHHLFVATEFAGRLAHDLTAPTLALCKAHVHA